MINFILILLTSFLVTTFSTPFAIKFAHKTNLLDHPTDNQLKIHLTPTPVLGGLSILLGILSCLILAVILFRTFQQEIVGLITALLVLFLIGLVDDFKELKPLARLLGQFFSALIAMFIGGFFVNLTPYPFINTSITILYLMGAINAINLLDGIDGLASGITLVASVGFLFGFMLSKNSLGIIISLGLMGVSIGFLIYNIHPAKIFLGDSGSTVLGFLLGIMAVLYSSKPYSIAHFMFPLLVLIVPITDTALAIIRRVKRHMPLSHGDRDHLYDQLIMKGLSQKQTMLLMCFFGLLGTLAGIYLIV